jgi:CubicO group peptidase (beta-lactamase class C family)
MTCSVLCVTLGALAICPARAAAPDEERAAERIPEAAAVLEGLEPEVAVAGEPGWSLEERMAHYDVSAVSLAVIDDYEIVWAEAFGLADAEEGTPATTETLFQAASVSKSVAAAGVLAAAQAGELDLDAPINSILTSWTLPANELTAVSDVTPRRLLSHTAGTTVQGFAGYAIDADVPTVVQVLEGAAPANSPPIRVDSEPGSRYRYSGGGSTVMQLAMTDLFGLPYPDLMEKRILGPIGMTNSSFEQPFPPSKLERAAVGYKQNGSPVWGRRHTYPEMAAAGLWTTATDLARFALDMQRALRGDEGTLLHRETVEQMITPVLGSSSLGFFQLEWGGALYFSHSGANQGFRAFLVASHEGGRGLALLSNSESFNPLGDEIRRAVTRAFDWPGMAKEPVVPAEVTAEELDALAGRYLVRGDYVIEMTRQGERLVSRWLLSDTSTWWIPTAEGTFVTRSDGAEFRFERDEAGAVTGYVRVDEEEPRARPRLRDDFESYVTLLDADRTDDAIARLRAGAMDEAALNELGYLLLGNRPEQAAAVFQLAVELYPRSANASDSLGECYLALGDAGAAVESYRRALEKLPSDTRIPEEQRPSYAARARTMIERHGEGE